MLKDGKRVPLYGQVCHGKGNARLFLDMWKRAFEMFIEREGKQSGDQTSKAILDQMKTWPGLDKPQFKQRSLNTWTQWGQYKNLPNRRAGMFFNVLPAPIDAGLGLVGYSYDVDEYFETSLYCQGGQNINVEQLLEDGLVWWQTASNEPASTLVGEDKPYRLQTVAEAIGPYFSRREFKTKGDYGKLERHKVVIFQREYVGKETNYLLDSDLPEDDETQIEDQPARPYFRSGFNPVLMKKYLALPDAVGTLGVASLGALKAILNGSAPSSHAQRVLTHLRKGTRYNEATGALEYDGAIREAKAKEWEAARITDLMRRAYEKMNVACRSHNSTARENDFDGPPSFKRYHVARHPIVELAGQFDLIPAGERHNDEMRVHAWELLGPLLGYDGGSTFIDIGFSRAQSGRVLRKDEAVALLENYLGITDYKLRTAEKIAALSVERQKNREKRKLQALADFADHAVKSAERIDLLKEIGHAFGREWVRLIVCVLTVCAFIGDEGFRVIVRKHISDRKPQPDFERMDADLVAQMNGHKDRVRALTRARVSDYAPNRRAILLTAATMALCGAAALSKKARDNALSVFT